MTESGTVRSGLVAVNGTGLYHEVRGDGPPIVFIPGGGGDGGTFDAVAGHLAADFTVVTYDRRGNSRSPRPARWTETTMTEQADDCLGLIDALGLEAPVLVGHSSGAAILVALLERDPGNIGGAIVFEPGLAALAPSAEAVFEQATELMAEGLAAGDPAAAMDAVSAWMFGEHAWSRMPTDVQTRIDANQDVNTGIELPVIMAHEPDRDALAEVSVPVIAAHGATSTAACRWFREAAQWVARATGGPLVTLPGGHLGPVEDPAAWASALAALLQRFRLANPHIS